MKNFHSFNSNHRGISVLFFSTAAIREGYCQLVVSEKALRNSRIVQFNFALHKNVSDIQSTRKQNFSKVHITFSC